MSYFFDKRIAGIKDRECNWLGYYNLTFEKQVFLGSMLSLLTFKWALFMIPMICHICHGI